jgi:RimJ/RimL family protein N-acetyltransferase
MLALFCLSGQITLAANAKEPGETWLTVSRPPGNARARQAALDAAKAAEDARCAQLLREAQQAEEAQERAIDIQKIIADPRFVISASGLILRPIATEADVNLCKDLHFGSADGLTDRDRRWIAMRSESRLGHYIELGVDSARVLTNRANWEKVLVGAPDLWLNFGIWVDNKMVGVISAYKYDDFSQRLFSTEDEDSVRRTVIVTAAIRPQQRRLGYGSAAKRLLIDYVFKTFNASRIVEIANPDNQGAIEFIRTLGFTPMAPPIPDPAIVGSDNMSHLLFFQLTRTAFEQSLTGSDSK